MGGHPYWYYVDYQPSVQTALDELREREFAAGRYNPVTPFLNFPIGPHSPAPGAQHATIEDAFADADADGTRSILDLFAVSETPDFGAVAPVEDEVLLDLYGTTEPTRAQIEQNMDFLEEVERGQGVYIVLYRDGSPHELFFAGYSYD